MGKSLLQKNPRLKILLPLLLVCTVWVLYVYVLTPQLAYRENLKNRLAALDKELTHIYKFTGAITTEERDRMVQELRTIRQSLGVGLSSQEIIILLEDKSKLAQVDIQNITFEPVVTKENLEQRSMKVTFAGSYQAILALLKSLEEYPSFAGMSGLTIQPAKDSKELTAEMKLTFMAIPENYAKKDVSSLPVRDNPFK
ncbi:MAG: hypothetical protein ACOY3J_05600 [Bacillota bacterium]|uniref:Type 4a pilus biogenesis protein PilO n=1 Tax=Thermanaerosceptrum fracticalcis TaxID=1712410 RepID=A0A7G6E0B4_THEFR|nr:hypothetical protein [Thermanaerosceptrum fracticalcis]QNB45518.1 hypothetical protein BR63_03810 [Thermanaerosceptrum fracticalcis]